MIKLTLIVFTFFNVVSATAINKADSLINELDTQIKLSQEYQEKKVGRIESLRQSLMEEDKMNNIDFTLKTYSKIYEEYKKFNSDSAYLYSKKLLKTAYNSKNPVQINSAKIKLSFILLSTGMFHECLDSLKSIQNINLMSNELKYEYYYMFARTYYDMADYSDNPDYRIIYNKGGDENLNIALNFTAKNSPSYLSLIGLKSIRNENYKLAISSFQRLLSEYELPDQEVAIAASSLAYLYGIKNQTDKAIELLAIAAIADIRSSTKETVAMTKLSELLFEKGDIQKAYKYVKVALKEAYFYKAKHRKLEISNILPIIEGKRLETVAGQRQLFIYYSIAVTLLSVLVIAFFVIILKQFKKLKIVKSSLDESNARLQQINEKLQEVNRIKEEYIGHFFNMISENIEAIEKFKNSISRKIKFNKMEDIASIIKNIDVDIERERLYSSFDAIFLKIFPGFIERFNALFKKEDHFILGVGESLPPEVRIFALIRLGIHDTETIAKILRYAVRTIYTYKTKIKNRSIFPNEEFEERLLNIKAF